MSSDVAVNIEDKIRSGVLPLRNSRAKTWVNQKLRMNYGRVAQANSHAAATAISWHLATKFEQKKFGA